MSSKSSPFLCAKMQDRDIGIGGTSLDLSFSQVIGIHSCIENKYLQDPGAVARLLLFADPMNLALHSAFFDIRHSLGVKSLWTLESGD